MSTTVYEKFGSPDGRFVNPVDGAGSSFTYTYVVLGTDNVTTATGAVAGAAPLVYLANDGQLLVRQEFIPRVTGPDSWEVDVRYGTEDDRKSHEAPDAGFWRFSFDTTGGSHKITQSLETLHRVEADPADPAPDLKQAIGWDGKKVNGVEIVVPKLEFDITAYYAPGTITTEYMKNLARKTGRTNEVTWLGFAEGEVLYMGSSGDGDVPLASGARVKPIPIRPCAGCGCDDKAAAMDENGPAWCREHLETIVDWLMEPARARLLLGALVRIAPEAARDVARNLVLEAITLAEGGQP